VWSQSRGLSVCLHRLAAEQADANQHSETSPVSLMSLRGTQALSNVDEEAHGGFEMVVHS
jgi:hypothetical protein